ncbi:PREDICTED: uncharacterized protein LOC109160596 [Ipomoea nil]|uniref:uncharacterized protein LOC109160596 n=1 Tax=Ipomoea nil TaxID=35883 RepID=UPI000900CE5C|nr:PREDICTED: uncharacterized protein LOC109160596 [Ipomoea nil]
MELSHPKNGELAYLPNQHMHMEYDLPKKMELSHPKNGESANTQNVQREENFVLLENSRLRAEPKRLLCSHCESMSFISEEMKTKSDILHRNADGKKKHANALAFLRRVFA